jgi:uncharacterized protein (DUF58 family)
MLGAATLWMLALLLFLSVLAHQAPLFVLSLALLVAAGVSKLYERYCLSGLEYRRRFSRRAADFGETIELEVEVVNRKLLPLAWLEIEDETPRALPPARGRVHFSHKPNRSLLTSLLALRPYERVRRHYPLPCLTRGEHRFGPVRLRTGDLFGLVTREEVRLQEDVLVVYPRVVPVAALGLPARRPLGELRTRSWLFEDPSRLAGVRDYRPGDSLRRIHWAATARTQRLQAKIYEATTSHTLMLFLNVQSTPAGWWGLGYDPDVLELSIMTAASLAAWAFEHGYQVGLVTNGMHYFRRTKVAVAPTGDPARLPDFLDALGRLQPIAVRPFETLLTEDVRQLPFGATIVAVTGVLTAPVVSALLALTRRGHAVTIVLTGRQDAPASLVGIPVRRVGPPEAWRELAELRFAGAQTGTLARR